MKLKNWGISTESVWYLRIWNTNIKNNIKMVSFYEFQLEIFKEWICSKLKNSEEVIDRAKVDVYVTSNGNLKISNYEKQRTGTICVSD